MPVTPDKSITLETRNQVMLERLKSGAQRQFQPVLKDIELDLMPLLLSLGGIIETKKEMNRVRIDSAIIVNDKLTTYINQDLMPGFELTAEDQAEFEFEALNQIVTEQEGEDDSIATELLVAAYLLLPMSIPELKTPLLNDFIRSFKNDSVRLVTSTIRQGFAQGKESSEIAEDIRGTKASNFNDGIFAKINRNHDAIVSTAIQHVATSSRHEAMKKKPFVSAYRWVSVLDRRTTATCRGLSGQVFEFGKGPLPPIHFRCRSSTAPVVDARFLKDGLSSAGIRSDLTYYDWIKTQPKSFQEDAIGIKFSKLLRDGNLTSDEFSKFSLDKNFEPLTLEEMRRKRPNVFKDAGL